MGTEEMFYRKEAPRLPGVDGLKEELLAFGCWESFRLERLYLEMNSARVRLQRIFNSKETRLLKGSRLLRPVRDTAISMNDWQKYTSLKVNGAVLWCLASSRRCQIHRRTENASKINSVELNFWIKAANHGQNWSLYAQIHFSWMKHQYVAVHVYRLKPIGGISSGSKSNAPNKQSVKRA